MFSRLVLQRRFRFALIGLLIGFFGLGIAVYRLSVEADTPTRPRTREISDVLSDTIKKTVDKLRAKPPIDPAKIASPAWPASKKLDLAASSCGFIAAVFAVSPGWLTSIDAGRTPRLGSASPLWHGNMSSSPPRSRSALPSF